MRHNTSYVPAPKSLLYINELGDFTRLHPVARHDMHVLDVEEKTRVWQSPLCEHASLHNCNVLGAFVVGVVDVGVKGVGPVLGLLFTGGVGVGVGVNVDVTLQRRLP